MRVLIAGAGYVGGELVRLLLGHPAVAVAAVTSRTLGGAPLWHAHPALRGTTGLAFTDPAALDAAGLDAAFVCAEHGQGAAAVDALRAGGFGGLVVDLSADHRLADPALYAPGKAAEVTAANTRLAAIARETGAAEAAWLAAEEAMEGAA